MKERDKLDTLKWFGLFVWTLLFWSCSLKNPETCTTLPDCNGLVGTVGTDSCLCFETRNGVFEALKLYRNDSIYEIWQNTNNGYMYHMYPDKGIFEIHGLNAFYRKTSIKSKDAPGTDLCLPLGERIFFSNCRHCHIHPSGLSLNQLKESEFNPKYESTGDVLRIDDAKDKHYILKIINQSDSLCLGSYIDSNN